MPKKLTQERLKELLHYDPKTGIFTRLKNISFTKKGDMAGCIDNKGYRTICIDSKRYLASRLAWFYMEGYFPEQGMDHKNRVRHDDRFENLRPASHQCNARNSKTFKTNKSGITGVHWNKGKGKWKAEVVISGKSIHLGYFNNKFDAARARWDAEVKHGFPNCNTTSSAYLYLKGRGPGGAAQTPWSRSLG